LIINRNISAKNICFLSPCPEMIVLASDPKP